LLENILCRFALLFVLVLRVLRICWGHHSLSFHSCSPCIADLFAEMYLDDGRTGGRTVLIELCGVYSPSGVTERCEGHSIRDLHCAIFLPLQFNPQLAAVAALLDTVAQREYCAQSAAMFVSARNCHTLLLQDRLLATLKKSTSYEPDINEFGACFRIDVNDCACGCDTQHSTTSGKYTICFH
jgi:hypothetical protein